MKKLKSTSGSPRPNEGRGAGGEGWLHCDVVLVIPYLERFFSLPSRFNAARTPLTEPSPSLGRGNRSFNSFTFRAAGREGMTFRSSDASECRLDVLFGGYSQTCHEFSRLRASSSIFSSNSLTHSRSRLP